MDIGNTLARIFPTGVVSYGNTDQGGFFKVLSLPQVTVPENCTVLVCGQTTRTVALQRRGSFLVKTNDFILFFHICIAQPDSGYAEFVMGRSCPHADHVSSRELQAYAHKNIRAAYA